MATVKYVGPLAGIVVGGVAFPRDKELECEEQIADQLIPHPDVEVNGIRESSADLDDETTEGDEEE